MSVALPLPLPVSTRLRLWAGRIPQHGWICLLALALRLFRLGAECLWYDEAFTWWISRLRGPDFWNAIAGDVHPPLWYLVSALNGAILGHSEAALRFPSVIFNTLAVLVLFHIARQLLPERQARLAALFAALLPAAGLYYAQEARMYSLLALLLLLALLAALQRRWVLFVGAAGLAVYTHNLAVLYVFALGAAAGLHALLRPPYWLECVSPGQRRRWQLAPLAASAAVFVLWLPWALVMLRQMGAMAGGFWLWPLFGPGDLLWAFTGMALGQRLPEWFVLHAYIAATALLLLALVLQRRRLLSWNWTLLLAATFAPPLLAAAVSLLWQPVFLPRAFICSAFLLPLWWAAALDELRPANRRLALAVLALTLGVGVVSYYTVPPDGNSRAARQDVAAFLAPVREGWREGDVIYHANLTTAILNGYYAQGLEYRLWPHAGDLNQSLTEQTKAAMGFRIAAPHELNDFARAWLIWQTNPMSTLPEQVATMAFLDAHPHQLVGTLYDNPLGRVALYAVSLRN